MKSRFSLSIFFWIWWQGSHKGESYEKQNKTKKQKKQKKKAKTKTKSKKKDEEVEPRIFDGVMVKIEKYEKEL